MAIKKFNSVEGFSVGIEGTLRDVVDNKGNVTANNLSVSGESDLGAVGNVIITGGSNKYVLQTDGAGNLTWADPTAVGIAGLNTEVQFNNAGTSGNSANFTFDYTTNTLNIGQTNGGTIDTDTINVDSLYASSYISTDTLDATVINTTGNAEITGNVNAGNVHTTSIVSTNLTGTITATSSSQPNITSLGTLTGLAVSGDATITGNLAVTGTTTYVNSTVTYVKDPITEQGGGSNGATLTTDDNKDRGVLLHYYNTEATDAFMGWDNSNGEFSFGSNVDINDNVITFNELGNVRANVLFANVEGTLRTASQPNITSVGRLTGLTVGNSTSNTVFGNGTIDASGNVTAANFNTTGDLSVANISATANLSVTGNASAANFNTAGNVSAANISASANLTVTGNASAANLNTTGTVIATGNVSGGNLTTSGQVVATGNVTGSNLDTSGNVVATGNVSGGNITTTGKVVATGNVETQGNLVATGNVIAQNISLSGSLKIADIINGTSNIHIVEDGNVAVSVAGTANVAIISSTGINVAGTLNATGNANVGNIGAQFGVFTGNVSAANLTASANLNVTGNADVGNLNTTKVVASGNISTTANITATGNVDSGNVNTSKVVATGNISTTANLTVSGNASVTGNLSVNKVTASDNISTTANVIASGNAEITGNVNAGNVNTAQVVATGDISTSANLAVTGNADVTGNLSANFGSFTGNVTSLNANLGNLARANYFHGVFDSTSSSQPNIHSVGTLSTLSVTANVTAGGVKTDNLYHADGTPWDFQQPAGANTQIIYNLDGDFGASANFTFDQDTNVLAVNGNITSGNIDGGNLVKANYFKGVFDSTSSSQPNITSVGTLTRANISGIANVSNTTESTSTSTGAIVTAGGLGVAKNAYIGGNLFVSGNTRITGNLSVSGETVTIGANNLTVNDSIINLHTNQTFDPLTSDDGKDIGLKMHYYKDSDKFAFAGWTNDTGYFEYYANGTESSGGVFSGDYGTFKGLSYVSTATTGTAPLVINSTTEVANLNVKFANVVTNPTQSNITSVGRLTSLTVGNATANTVFGNGTVDTLGNISTGNIKVTGNLELTSTAQIKGEANVTGNANIAGNLDVTGNVSGKNFTTTGNVYADRIFLTGGLEVTSMQHGTSNIVLDENSNIHLSVGGTSNVLVITTTGANVDGTLTATGNISTTANLTVSGNAAVTGNLTSGNANLGNLATANFFHGKFDATSSSQPNITSVGTLAGLSVDTNDLAVSGVNVNVTNGNIKVSAGGGIYVDNYFYSDGTPFDLQQPAGSNTEIVFNLNGDFGASSNLTYNKDTNILAVTSGNVNAGNVNAVGRVVATGNVSGANVIAHENLEVEGNAAITGNVTVTKVTATGNISTTANLVVSGNADVTGNLTSSNANLGNLAVANYVTGTLTTHAQPNITSVGTLTGLTTSGNISVSNATATNGILTDNLYYSNGQPWDMQQPSGSNTEIVFNLDGNFGASSKFTFDKDANVLTVVGNIVSGNATLGNLVTANYFSGNGSLLSSITGANVTGAVAYATTANAVAGGNVSGAVAYATTANSVAGGNVSGQVANALVAGTVYTAAQTNITSVGTLTTLSVSGDITASSNVDVTGNVNASYFIGDLEGNVVAQTITRDGKNVPTFVSSTTLPSNPQLGDQWYDNAHDVIYQYIYDGVSYHWIDVSSGFISACAAPVSSTLALRDSNANIYANAFIGNRIEVSGIANIKLPGGTTGQAIVTDGAGNLSFTTITTSAGGSDTQVQFNDNGVFVGNANLTFNKTTGTLAAYAFSGNGASLSSLTGGNVTGQVGNALVAGTVYTNAQPNITSVGSLTGLTVSNATGNVDFTTTAHVKLGAVSNLQITGGSSGYILQTDGTGNLEWVDNVPTTTTFNANSIALTNGVFVSGSVTSIQSFGDYAAGNVFVLTDGTGSAPAWYVDIDFISVTAFNRVVLNINYTQASGHTIYVQLYNNVTSTWDSIGTYTGLGSYYAFALEVIDSTPYLDSGRAQLKLYHSNAGNAGHQTSIDYAALELSSQGPQGPRGPTGATGATGPGVASGGTTGQVLVKSNSTNYATQWSSDLALPGNIDADGNAHIGGDLSVVGNITFTGNGTINQITGNGGQFYGDEHGIGALYAGLASGYATVYNPVIQASADANAYVQINFQNINHGTQASTDFCATSDNGTDTKFFIDMGIVGSTWDGTQENSVGTAALPDDGYLYVQGDSAAGNLILGTITSGTSVKFLVGGPNSANIVGTISNTGANFKNITTPGNLTVTGNTTINGNLIINGTMTSINSTQVEIDDLTLVVANDASSASFANGAGFIINGANASMLYNSVSNALVFSHPISASGNLLSNIQGANVSGAVSYATTANNIAGSNVAGAVAYATTANSVAGANVSGAVAYATTANSVAGANVTGAVAYATTANSVAGSNVSGAVSLATYATTANAVAGANVSGAVAYATTANSVAGANVSGAVSYATTANSVAGSNVSGQVGNALVAGTVYTNAQPNITSVGILSSLAVTANITVGNITANGSVTANSFVTSGSSGNISGANVITANTIVGLVGANFVGASNVSLGSVSNLHISGGSSGQYLSTDGSGTLTWGTISTSGVSNGTSNIAVISSGNVNLTAAGNTTLVVTGTGVNVAGTINGTGNLTVANANLGNSATANFFIGSGNNLSNIQAANITGTVANANYSAYAGNITVNAQPNITSVGTLTGLTVGNSTANTIFGNGTIAASGNANVANINAVNGVLTGNLVLGGNLTVSGTTTYVNSTVISYVDPIIELNAAPNGGLLASDNNKDVGFKTNYFDTSAKVGFFGRTDNTGYFEYYSDATETNGVITGTYGVIKGDSFVSSTTANAPLVINSTVRVANLNASSAGLANTVNDAAQPNITSVGILTSVTVSGNANVGNIGATQGVFTGNVSSLNANLGNLTTANFFTGTLTTHAQPNITSVGTLSGLTVSGLTSLGSVGNVSITGGTSGYVLTTNGSGGLSWAPSDTSASASFVSSVKVAYVGDGSTASYTLPRVPASIDAVTVNIDGLVQQQSTYTLSGAVVTFGSALASGQNVEFTIYGVVPLSGVNTQVYFNDAGNIGNSANFAFDKTTKTLTVDKFVGNGAGLTNITATTAGTVTASSQPNITSVGTLNGLSVSGHIIPTADITYDLGNTTRRFRDLHLSGQTIQLGDSTLSQVGDTLVLTNPIGGQFIVDGSNAAYASLAAYVTEGNQSNITQVGNLISLHVDGNIAANNVSTVSNLTIGGGYLTIDTGIIAVNNGNAGIFTTGISNVNIGLSSNVTIGSSSGTTTLRGNVVFTNTSATGNVSGNVGSFTSANIGNSTVTGTLEARYLKVGDIYSSRAPVYVTTNTIIDSFNPNTYRSAKYTIRVNSDDGYQAAEVLLIHDGSSAYVTIYGSLSTIGYDIVLFAADISAGNVQLYATSASANTTVNLLGTYVAD